MLSIKNREEWGGGGGEGYLRAQNLLLSMIKVDGSLL